MRNKIFILVLAIVILVFVHLAEAQQLANKVYRIGYLSGPSGFDSSAEAFRQGLRELGYIEGQNIVIEWRFAKGRRNRHERAAELVRLKVDCIVTRGTLSTRAAKQATSTIPIVMANVGHAVQRGFVASLARPGGNITGLITRSPDLAGKRLELLKEALPQVSRVALLWDPTRLGTAAHFRGTEVAARALGVQLQSLEVRPPYDFEDAFRAAGKGRAHALIVAGAGLGTHRAQIVNLEVKNRLPAMHSSERYVLAGGLMSYASDRVDQFRRAAIYVDKILKGHKPADLPVERPTKFEFAINLKAAKKIGLTISPEVLFKVDKVIK